ncbi:hypothetical protein, partial [Snodgrassella communis]|uniref:hypothetical protein n=1 Tax=Snodgrassella communis TaxID=2946699 RepID=UPI001EF586B9
YNFFYNDNYAIENFIFKDKTVTLAELRKNGMELYGTRNIDVSTFDNNTLMKKEFITSQVEQLIIAMSYFENPQSGTLNSLEGIQQLTQKNIIAASWDN